MDRSTNLMFRGIVGIVVGVFSLYFSFFLRTKLDYLYQQRIQQGNSDPPLQMVGISLIIISVVGLIAGVYYIIEAYHLNKRENVDSSYHPLEKNN